MRKDSPEGSLIDRKRPAMKGLIEDLIGPTSRIDEIISQNPFPVEKDLDFDEEEKQS